MREGVDEPTDSGSDESDYSLNRRTYIQVAGALAAPLAAGGKASAATDSTDGYGEGGFGETTFGGSRSGLSVQTDGATSVGDTSATLAGELLDLGGASSADVYFEWGESGGSLPNQTSVRTLSSSGTFSADLTGLASGTTYEFRAVADASDGTSATGGLITVTTTSTDTSVAVTTDTATNVGETSATLDGTLTDLGGASSADVYFEWGESGGSLSNQTSARTLSSTGSFSADLSGLASGTTYEFRAVADASDGDSATGGLVTVTTDSTDTSVDVATGAATDVGETSMTLNGDVADLGGASSADVYFEWGQDGGSLSNRTSVQTLSSTGSFGADLTDLQSGTTYEFRAVADASDGDSDAGALRTSTTVTTDSTDHAPEIDSYTVTEAGKPNPHAEITAEWSVSDADGDLQMVFVEVVDSNRTVSSSASTIGSGSSASGTEQFKLRHVGSATYDVRLTVVDARSQTATRTETVQS